MVLIAFPVPLSLAASGWVMEGAPLPGPQAAPRCLHMWEPRSHPSLSPLRFLLSPCRAGAVGGRAKR